MFLGKIYYIYIGKFFGNPIHAKMANSCRFWDKGNATFGGECSQEGILKHFQTKLKSKLKKS